MASLTTRHPARESRGRTKRGSRNRIAPAPGGRHVPTPETTLSVPVVVAVSVATAVPVAVAVPENRIDHTFTSVPVVSSAPPSRSITGRTTRLSPDADDVLARLGVPTGLRAAIIESSNAFSTRIWVLDNSGSMFVPDATKFVVGPRGLASVTCSRWEELQDTIGYHLELTLDLNMPADFRLLNPGYEGKQILPVSSEDRVQFKNECMEARRVIEHTIPSHLTPLSTHIHAVHDRIQREAEELRRKGQRVCVVLATDGVPSDNPRGVYGGPEQAFKLAMNSLHGLPVLVVVRLLTNQDDVVEYWNALDQNVEIPLEVLDDWRGEAQEVFSCNPWLSYTQALHHAREMGLKHPIFDVIDERPLCAAEVVQYAELVFGRDRCRGLPNPDIDFNGFDKFLTPLLQETGKSFNILTKKSEYWMSLPKLRAALRRARNSSADGCVLL